jgi:hypothetical protein
MPHRGTLLLALLLIAPPLALRGQNVVLDEGTFRLTRAGQEIGTETFTIRRIGQGADAHVIANAVLELEGAAGHEQIKPLLKAGLDGSVSAYQVEISGRQPSDLAVTLNGRRFVARRRTPSGEQEQEYRAAPGAVLLERDVAHQYWFRSQLREGAGLFVLQPLSGAQAHVVVKAMSDESLTLSTGAVAARHVTFETDRTPGSPATLQEVWYDAAGRVLEVRVPATGFRAERTTK